MKGECPTWYNIRALKKKEDYNLRILKSENKTRGALLPKVVATGALAAMLCSAAPRENISASERRVEQNLNRSAGYTYNVNNSYEYPGVTIADGKISYKLPSIVSKNIRSYKSLAISVNGKSIGTSALMINSTLYFPLRAFASAVGATSSYNSATRTTTVRANGLVLTATDGAYVTYANDRPLFGFSPSVIMSDGRMYVPASSLLRAMGLTESRTQTAVSVSGTLKPLATAAKYYREDEVFWLARIITAEARGESLLGQIAVGNVIMNRVASGQYPNTIYGVIFDRKWGVQFSPVLDGSIYNTPTYNATLAAKICLEGTKLSQQSLFFLNPITAESSWIIHSREYLYSIGGHDFYS